MIDFINLDQVVFEKWFKKQDSVDTPQVRRDHGETKNVSCVINHVFLCRLPPKVKSL